MLIHNNEAKTNTTCLKTNTSVSENLSTLHTQNINHVAFTVLRVRHQHATKSNSPYFRIRTAKSTNQCIIVPERNNIILHCIGLNMHIHKGNTWS